MATKPGCMSFNLGWKADAANSEKMEKFFSTTHESFMKKTHHTSGDEEPRPLVYYVMKAPVLKDFTDPSKGSTGEFFFGMNEIYRGASGLATHMKIASEKDPKMLEEILSYGDHMVAPGFASEVICCFEDPMEDAWKNINKDCHGFQISLVVPNGETGPVEAWLKEHEAFMRKTHPTTGDAELRTLTYTATKNPIAVDPNDPSKGVTDKTLYTICELYRNEAGCAAHMKAGQATGELFARFVELVQKYSVMPAMFGKVVGCF